MLDLLEGAAEIKEHEEELGAQFDCATQRTTTSLAAYYNLD